MDELLVKATNRTSVLDGHTEYLLARFTAGVTDTTVLLAELRERGYTGSVQTIRRYLHPLREARTTPPIRPRPTMPKPRRITRWIMTDPDHHLDPDDRAQLTAIIGACPELAATARHVRDFADLMNKHRGDRINARLQQVEADNLPHLHSLTTGLRRDLPAVTAGLTEQHNSCVPAYGQLVGGIHFSGACGRGSGAAYRRMGRAGQRRGNGDRHGSHPDQQPRPEVDRVISRLLAQVGPDGTGRSGVSGIWPAVFVRSSSRYRHCVASEPPAGLAALYYPYSRSVDLTTLKLLAILYDEIVFVDPLEDVFREFLISSDKGCQFVPDSVRRRWNDNQESFALLRDRGLVRIIDPLPHITEHDQVLAAAYASDMADDAFVRLAEDGGKAAGPWKMLASRIPPTVNDAFEHRKSLAAVLREAEGTGKPLPYRESDYQFGVYAWEQYDHDGYRDYLLQRMGGRQTKIFGTPFGTKVGKNLDSSALDPFEQLYLSGAGTDNERGVPFGMHPYKYANTVSFRDGERIRILAFSQGASLSISQALLLADHYGLTPVTDSSLHQQLLAMKYRRALANVSLLDRPAIPARSPELLERYSVVGRTVLLAALAPAFLEQISLGEALDFRDANREALARFRGRIAELSHDLDDAPPGRDLNDQLAKLVDQKVVPALQALGDQLHDSRRRMFGNVISRVATTAVPASAAVSLFAAFSGPALLALGVGIGAAAFGLSVSGVVERWQEHKRLGQDWLAFCLGLRRTTRG